jgi:N-acetylglutamate synthase-like GNAT family acetyltransferase
MTSSVDVRLAVPSDTEGIADVLLEAFGEYREDYTPEAFEIVTPSADEVAKRFAEGPQWVAEINGEILGTVSVTTEPEGLYVRSMAVRPDSQGHGIGHKLMDAVNDHADASEHERIFLYTTYFVPGAKEFYGSHGYRWVRDTTAEEWYGTPGLEMERKIERKKQNAIGS